MNIGCRIVQDFDRPDIELIKLFENIPVANIDDCMNRTGAISQKIRPLNTNLLLGTAFTVKVPEGDNLMFHKAMDMANPGDIIMIDAGGHTERAILGELMVSYCESKGIGGIVVNGSIRGADALKDKAFPIYTKGITPNGPFKNGPGEINTPISIGGKVVSPGDIVVGDQDGLVIIQPENAEKIAKLAKGVTKKEHLLMKKIKEDGIYERPWVNKVLSEIGCEYE